MSIKKTPGEKETGNQSDSLVPVQKTLQAEASSAHSRINIPLNLDNWQSLPEEVGAELLWFHQHILDQKLDWTAAEQALSYDRSTLFRVLKGTYTGSWNKVVEAIRGYRKLSEQRSTIRHQEFVKNSIAEMVFAGLDYAVTNNSITTITGESRMGKTIAAKKWCEQCAHGRAVFITAPPVGGAKALIRMVAGAVGVNKAQSLAPMMEAVYRAFNRNRILVVDEAHRCLPSDTRTVNPAVMEFLRDLHDQTDCSLALISTQRLMNGLKRGSYQYEQLLGRVGMPILLKPKLFRSDLLPIVKQFIKAPSATLMDEMVRIANEPGRMGIVIETLKVASRFASKAGSEVTEDDVRKAMALRAQMSGGAL